MTHKSLIDCFDGEYAFLSNFYPVKLAEQMPSGGTLIYPTAEHAFQAAKTLNATIKRRVANEETPGKAKRAGGRRGYVDLRPDWEDIKDQVMFGIVLAKFSGILGQQLIDTGEAELVEGNNWNDTYWGVCNGVGQNKLGHILMKVRSQLMAEQAMY